jgi:glyoxylase-like metal-dependent hydrolase (beta-lactamase superfamily II)
MEITKGVYSLDSAKFAHVFYIAEEETLIDSGMVYERKNILKELSGIGAVKKILLTHHHFDHSGGAGFLQKKTGSSVYIHSEDLPYLSKSAGKETATENKKGLLTQLLGRFLSAESPEKLRPLDGTVNIGAIKVIPATGHTLGHCIFKYNDILFTGDLFFNKHNVLSLPNPEYNSDIELLRSSLERLKSIDFKTACPSHGSVVYDKEKLLEFAENER